MLHAELHGKLAAEANDAERREDILTSTVFGLLFATGAWELLFSWLNRAHPIGHAEPLCVAGSAAQRYWFWPRLDDAEPDLIVRAGPNLIVIEAKYHSGKSGGGSARDLPGTSADQLVREWQACSPDAELSTCPAPLVQAIQSCARVLVYLVKRSRWAREKRAIEASAERAPGARMYLLTWEDLDEVLALHDASRSPWPDELRRFLKRRGLSAFRGFRETIAGIPGTAAKLGAWRGDPSSSGDRLHAAFPSTAGPMLERLASWHGHQDRAIPTAGWAHLTSPASLPRLASLAALAPRFSQRKG